MKENHLRSLIYTFILSGILFLLAHACGDDNPKLIQERPTLSTSIIENITKTTATSGGAINNDGEAEVTARGICWSTNENPTITDNKTQDGKGTGGFSSTLEELLPNTTYFVRAYATNVIGTAYGNSVTFKTQDGVIDIDGNIYNVVKIGEQFWIKENLKTTKFNDGTPIAMIADDIEWSQQRVPAYCWYNNDKATYGEKYGALYNWQSLKSEKLCPVGWHVASDDEWIILTLFIGNYTGEGHLNAAPKLRATSDWATPGSDEFDFSALPAGKRFYNGDFFSFGETACWWSDYDESTPRRARIIYDKQTYMDLNIYNTLPYGLSIRCVRD